MIFRSIFHAFSGTPLGATFLRFYVDFSPKSAILEPPWAPPGLQIRPLERPFRPKYRLLSDTADEGNPHRPALAPTWRPTGAQEAPQRPKAPILSILGATWRPNGSKHRPKGRPKVDFSHILMSEWLHCSKVLTSHPKHQTKTFIFRRCSIRLSSPPRPNDDHQR